MTREQFNEYRRMVKEFESSPEPDDDFFKSNLFAPLLRKRRYVFAYYFCDGGCEQEQIFVNAFGCKVLLNYLSECGVYATAKKD